MGLALLGSVALGSAPARADGTDQPPGPNERVVKIGPQAIVVVNRNGGARMYDSPAEDVQPCEGAMKCLGKAIGIFGFFFVAEYEELTENVAAGSAPPGRFPAEE